MLLLLSVTMITICYYDYNLLLLPSVTLITICHSNYYLLFYLLLLSVTLITIFISRRCPICRKEIRSWTTMNIVRLTLNEQKQEAVGSDIVRLSLNEQKQEGVGSDIVRLTLNEQKQGGVGSDIPCTKRVLQFNPKLTQHNQDTRHKAFAVNRCRHISTEKSFELCRFDSSAHFLHCLNSLRAAKAQLSFLEILLILRSNLSIGLCQTHLMQVIEKSQACDLILCLQLVESPIKFVLRGAVKRISMMRLLGTEDRTIRVTCFHNIKLAVKLISSAAADKFPTHSQEIGKKETSIITMIDKIELIFNVRGKP